MTASCLVGTACRDENGLVFVLLKVPRLHTVFLVQHLKVAAREHEFLAVDDIGSRKVDL